MLVDEGGSRPSEALLHIMMPYISKQKGEGFDVRAPPWRGRRRWVCAKHGVDFDVRDAGDHILRGRLNVAAAQLVDDGAVHLETEERGF